MPGAVTRSRARGRSSPTNADVDVDDSTTAAAKAKRNARPANNKSRRVSPSIPLSRNEVLAIAAAVGITVLAVLLIRTVFFPRVVTHSSSSSAKPITITKIETFHPAVTAYEDEDEEENWGACTNADGELTVCPVANTGYWQR